MVKFLTRFPPVSPTPSSAHPRWDPHEESGRLPGADAPPPCLSLVPYAMRFLDEEQEIAFEGHLLVCDACFERLRRFDSILPPPVADPA